MLVSGFSRFVLMQPSGDFFEGITCFVCLFLFDGFLLEFLRLGMLNGVNALADELLSPGAFFSGFS